MRLRVSWRSGMGDLLLLTLGCLSLVALLMVVPVAVIALCAFLTIRVWASALLYLLTLPVRGLDWVIERSRQQLIRRRLLPVYETQTGDAPERQDGPPRTLGEEPVPWHGQGPRIE